MADETYDQQPSCNLTGRLQDGDDEAASILFKRFGPWLEKAIASKIGYRLRARVDSDDIMQSTFWSFFRRSGNGEYEFDHSGAVCRMLLEIAANKIRRAARFNSQECRNLDLEVPNDVGELQIAERDWQTTAGELAESIDEIAHVVDSLEPRDAEFFRRRYFLGHSADKISADTGWSLATVKRVLKRSTQRVRERVENRHSK